MVLKSLGKKGVIFTILALLLSTIIIGLFFSFKDVPLDNNVQNVQMRIKHINSYIEQVEEYVKDSTKSSAINALDFAINEMINRSAYYSDFDQGIDSCMRTGLMATPGNSEQLMACPEEAILQNNIQVIEDFAEEHLTIPSDINIEQVSLVQTSPWQITFIINYSVLVQDTYASWNSTKTTNQTISIIGLNDPTYWIVDPTLSSYKYLNTIKQAENQGLWLEEPSIINFLTVNKIYFKYEQGPSFLNRLRGNMSNSTCCGIASVVPPLDSFYADELSHLDYIFWKNNTCHQTEEGEYYRFNFWKAGMTEEQRFSMGVAESGYGVNGSTVPPSFMTFVNMTDTSYIDIITPTCS